MLGAPNDPAEHRVLEVQPRVVDEVDEELRVAGVAAAGRQPHGSAACEAALISSFTNGPSPTYSLAPGLPPWITKFGTTRWKVKPS